MSFDVFFQRFTDGDAGVGGGDQMRRVLAPFMVREDQSRYVLVEYGDGTADVYLSDNSMMANHVSGESPWEILVQGAGAADWVILPVGCPACITAEAQRQHLPDGLGDDAVLVSSGEELLRVILSS